MLQTVPWAAGWSTAKDRRRQRGSAAHRSLLRPGRRGRRPRWRQAAGRGGGHERRSAAHRSLLRPGRRGRRPRWRQVAGRGRGGACARRTGSRAVVVCRTMGPETNEHHEHGTKSVVTTPTHWHPRKRPTAYKHPSHTHTHTHTGTDTGTHTHTHIYTHIHTQYIHNPRTFQNRTLSWRSPRWVLFKAATSAAAPC